MPTEPVHGGVQPPAQIAITPLMVEHLKATKPWVLLCSVLGFIGTGMFAVAAVAIVAITAFAGVLRPGTDTLPWGVAESAGIAVFYAVLGVPYFFGSLFLWRYSSAITRLPPGGETRALEDALQQQKSFWRLVGISIVAMFALYGLLVVGLVVVGIAVA